MNELILSQGDRFYQVDVTRPSFIDGYYVTECAWDASGGLTWEREAGIFRTKRDAVRKAVRLYAAHLRNTADL